MEECQERICQENVKNRPQLHRSQLQAAPALKPHKIRLALDSHPANIHHPSIANHHHHKCVEFGQIDNLRRFVEHE